MPQARLTPMSPLTVRRVSPSRPRIPDGRTGRLEDCGARIAGQFSIVAFSPERALQTPRLSSGQPKDVGRWNDSNWLRPSGVDRRSASREVELRGQLVGTSASLIAAAVASR
jgi:hypothetical protein